MGLFDKKKRPSFVAYVMVRFGTLVVSVCLAILYLVSLFSRGTLTFGDVAFFVASLGIAMLFAVYYGAESMARQIREIETYLSDFEKAKEKEETFRISTRETADLLRRLKRVLKKARKREATKKRYTAKLKLKNRQRADMISAIAHEFRNPIAAITGYAQTLHEEDDLPQSLRKKFLEKIHNNALKIEELLKRLVLWNKFESGETVLHRSRIDIYRLAEEVTAALEEKYKGRKVNISGGSCLIDADRTLMETLLKNLIENALKYSKEDVDVAISSEAVSVRDYGIGIEEKELSKITKKFYRSGMHTWDNSMGLGLAIVKTIVKLHDFTLDIESVPGKGSRFTVRCKREEIEKTDSE